MTFFFTSLSHSVYTSNSENTTSSWSGDQSVSSSPALTCPSGAVTRTHRPVPWHFAVSRAAPFKPRGGVQWCSALTWSSDGNTLYCGGTDGQIYVYETQPGKY